LTAAEQGREPGPRHLLNGLDAITKRGATFKSLADAGNGGNRHAAGFADLSVRGDIKMS
jgi:hypothetical protein